MRTCELPEEEDEQLDDNFVVIVIVAAVVELGGQPFLFNRLLDRAFFSPDGDLERITLMNAERRCVKDDEHNQQDSAYYAIAGDTFVLRLSEVKTVNFLYYAIMPGDDEFEGYQISDFLDPFGDPPDA